MNYVKKITSVITITSTIFISLVATAMGETQENIQSETQIAANLGMLQGEGNGLTDAYLSKPTTRIQAAIMYLRLKGIESEALNYQGMDSFKDANLVGESNQHILAYLKANPSLGWVGTGSNQFDPLSKITAQQFYKVLLEALGYKQGTDFEYSNVLSFAASKGLNNVANIHSFINRNISTAAVEALRTTMKDSSQTLADALIAQQKIDPMIAEELNYPRLNLMSNAALGTYLTDSEGRTLYYFTKDVADTNSCQGACLENWPIFYKEKMVIPAQLNAADFGVVSRNDGAKQITYKGWPIYYFANDKKAGETNGDSVKNVWYAIKVPPYTTAIGTKADLGNYLTDENGMTPYYFDKDTMGESNCSGDCLTKWPAFYRSSIVVPSGLNADDFGTITRPDGSKQTTYKGRPLYYFFKDIKRGDTNGQNVKNIWHVISPGAF